MHCLDVSFITSPLHPGCNGGNYMILHDYYMLGKMLMTHWQPLALALYPTQSPQCPGPAAAGRHRDCQDLRPGPDPPGSPSSTPAEPIGLTLAYLGPSAVPKGSASPGGTTAHWQSASSSPRGKVRVRK